MWLIFIVVVVVLSVLMVFMLTAIRMLAKQAKEQLNHYFLKNLETYDRLAENKTAEIDELQGQIDELQGRIDNMKARIAAMAEANKSRPVQVQYSSGGVEAASYSDYRDPGFFEDYAYVRNHMKLDYRAYIQEIIDKRENEQDPQVLLCQSMLEKIPMDYLYEIITMQEIDQVEYLKELFDDEEDAYIDNYAEENGCFDLLAFHSHLTNYVKGHENAVYIRTGTPESYKDLESKNVHVLFDPDIHEGVRVSYKNTVYDFSI